MKKSLTILITFLLSTTAWAQNLQYEADPGLIPLGFTDLIVFYDSEGPLSYQTMTHRDVPDDAILLGEVLGESCQRGLRIPIFFLLPTNFRVSGAMGNGSYKKALLDIKEKHPDLDGLYDVKVDIHIWSILTVYIRDCTNVVARGFKLKDSDESSVLISE